MLPKLTALDYVIYQCHYIAYTKSHIRYTKIVHCLYKSDIHNALAFCKKCSTPHQFQICCLLYL